MVEHRKLAGKHLRVEGNLRIHAEFLVGQDEQMLSVFAPHFYLMPNDVVFLLGILFLQAHALDFLHEHQG